LGRAARALGAGRASAWASAAGFDPRRGPNAALLVRRAGCRPRTSTALGRESGEQREDRGRRCRSDPRSSSLRGVSCTRGAPAQPIFTFLPGCEGFVQPRRGQGREFHVSAAYEGFRASTPAPARRIARNPRAQPAEAHESERLPYLRRSPIALVRRGWINSREGTMGSGSTAARARWAAREPDLGRRRAGHPAAGEPEPGGACAGNETSRPAGGS
jgi:hypothetical protein